MTLNVFGEPVEPEDPNDPFWVPEDQRKDVDEGPESDALDDLTGDDLDGWKPGDPV